MGNVDALFISLLSCVLVIKMLLLFVFQVSINTKEQRGDVSMASSSHVVSLCVAHNAHDGAGKE